MKRPQLKAEERTVLGKKVKKLRREGLLPGNVYGKGLSSYALQVKLSDFEAAYKEAGDTGLIDLSYDGKTKPVLVKNLQRNYANHTLLHADFYQVNMKEKVKTMVPVLLIGEAKAVTDKIGLVIQSLSDVEVEALPDSLPENVEISVEHLAEVGDQVTVADLKTPEGVEILTDAGQTIAKVNELVAEEPEPEEPVEGAEGETTEGEAKEGGEASEESSETPSEEKKEE
jgi:large subunit ribosomal protein L25